MKIERSKREKSKRLRELLGRKEWVVRKVSLNKRKLELVVVRELRKSNEADYNI